MFDAAEVLARLAEHTRYLRGSECRLLVHLTAAAVKSGSPEVPASENQIAAALHLGHSQITKAKRRLEELALVVHEPGDRRTPSRFYLAYLRQAEVPLFQGQGAPVSGAEVPLFQGQGAPVSGAEVPLFQGQGAPVSGAGAPTSGAAGAHGLGHDRDGHARASNSNSEVVCIGSISSIEGVLQTKTLSTDERESAALLARYLRSWAARHGKPGLADGPIDDTILAQCLAIGPLGTLEAAWIRIAARLRNYQVESWGFFVNALLAEVYNVTPTAVSTARSRLRKEPKCQDRSADSSWPQRAIHELVTRTKVLR